MKNLTDAMRCELVQRPTIFKADRPMNHELCLLIIASLKINLERN